MAHPPQLSTDRFVLKLGLFYAAYFLFGGIQLPFFPLWLEARGLDAATIGIVIAVPMLARIVAVPFITRAADRHRAIKATLTICSAVGALAMTLVGLADGVFAILLAFTVAAVAVAPIIALSDAYALSGLGERGRAYGPVRLWGSVAFIAANVGAGYLLGAISAVHLIWLIVAALLATVIAAIALDPLRVPVAAGPRAPASGLWRNPAFLAVAAAASLTQGSHALYYGFSTMEWRGAGLDGVTIGALWGLGVVAEVVLFAYSARLPAALTPLVLLGIGAVGAVLRWTAMAFDPPTTLLPMLQILHACSFGAAHLGAMGFLARTVPKDLAATAQGLVATASGIVMAAATGLSGLIYAASGSLAYLAMAAMALAGLACALAARRYARQD